MSMSPRNLSRSSVTQSLVKGSRASSRSLNLAGDLGLLLRVETLVGSPTKQGQMGDLFAPPEERIRAVLEQFVSDESANGGTRRRLFADDAAHGVALLGIAEKRFDVVLMNPPFGAGSARAKRTSRSRFRGPSTTCIAAFVERGIELLAASRTSRRDHFANGFFPFEFSEVARGNSALAPPRPPFLPI